jgi:ABC-type transport system involved in multi-copper enzyme maturation permease subunit
MKGLLLKDFYMSVKYCRIFLLIIVIFSAVSLMDDSMGFFSTFPVLIAGMLPVTLLSYDEKEKWHIYSGTFPYSRDQLVSSKYIFGLLVSLAALVFSAAVLAIRLSITNSFSVIEFLSSVAGMFTAGLLGSALVLPFIFKLGAEKGRIMYFVVIIAIFGLGMAYENLNVNTGLILGPAAILAVTTIGTVILYAVSWLMSISFYRKREL